MRAVRLRERIETFGRTWSAGAVLYVQDDYDEGVNLVDGSGFLRISLCPAERLEELGEDAVDSGTATTILETLATAESDDSRSPADSEAVDLYTAGFEDGATAGLVNHGAAERGESCQEAGKTSSDKTSAPSSTSSVFVDPNIEAQLARGSTPARVASARPGVRWVPESSGECPFEAGQFLVSADSAAVDPLEAPTPLPVVTYVRGDHLERHGATRWTLSVEHARRHEWGPEWWLSPAGFPAGERVLFYARRLDRPGPPEGVKPSQYDGPEWRYFVDLDRGEWSEWGSGEWRPVANGLSLVASGEGVTTEALRHGEEACPAMKVKTTIEMTSTATSRSTTGIHARMSPSAPIAMEPVSVTPVVAAACSAMGKATTNAMRVCQPGEFPEPGPWMSSLERLGWRSVNGVTTFGADSVEGLPVFREWLSRLRAYFGEGVAA